MATHPFSHQFVCGFEGILKFYCRVEGEMNEVWKETLACSAASYSSTGSLVLSVIEDSYSSLLLYDCYNFQKLRVIPVSFLELVPIKIEWTDDNSALLLASQTEFLKLNVFSGEKISEFR